MILGCPRRQPGVTNTGLDVGTIAWTPPIATDNSGHQNLTSDFDPGHTFPHGITPVTYTATDPAGNSETCTFDVVVYGELHS